MWLHMPPFPNPGNMRDGDGRTPLSWAAERRHEAVINLLLKNGAKVNYLESPYVSTWDDTKKYWPDNAVMGRTDRERGGRQAVAQQRS